MSETTTPGSAVSAGPTGSGPEPTLGELVATASRDLSTLLRKEIELAKVEIKGDLKAAGLGAGLFGGAGFLGYFALIFLSIALAFGIGAFLSLGVGFLIVGAAYGLLAAVFALVGRKKITKVGPPARTIETVKDDIAWARHPTAAASSKPSGAIEPVSGH